MGPDTLRSPTVIPPRTSSTIGTMTTTSTTTTVPNANQTVPRSILKVVPEADWMSQGKKGHSHSSSLGGVNVGPESQGKRGHHHHPHSSGVGTESQGEKNHSHSLSSTGTGGPDPSRHISDDLIYQRRSTWSPDKEKVCEIERDEIRERQADHC